MSGKACHELFIFKCEPCGQTPQSQTDAKLQIKESPSEWQAIESRRAGKDGKLMASLNYHFERNSSANSQNLAEDLKRFGRKFDIHEPSKKRNYDVHC